MLSYWCYRCEDFIAHCEILSVVYGDKTCCKHFFNPEPIYTTFGTCFISYDNVTITQGGMQSRAMVYLKILHQNCSKPIIEIVGEEALIRRSPWFALTYEKPTEYVLLRNAHHVRTNTMTYFPLEVAKVKKHAWTVSHLTRVNSFMP